MIWLKKAWNWSRTVFLNAVSLIGAATTEILAYALALDWASVINNPKVLFWWVMGMNVLNILLRLDTRGPVGGKG